MIQDADALRRRVVEPAGPDALVEFEILQDRPGKDPLGGAQFVHHDQPGAGASDNSSSPALAFVPAAVKEDIKCSGGLHL